MKSSDRPVGRLWRAHLLLAACLLAGTIRAGTPVPLAEAIKVGIDDQTHWAYTESRETWDHKGRSEGKTIFRFDASKPYNDRFEVQVGPFRTLSF